LAYYLKVTCSLQTLSLAETTLRAVIEVPIRFKGCVNDSVQIWVAKQTIFEHKMPFKVFCPRRLIIGNAGQTVLLEWPDNPPKKGLQ
tara:strand:- start:261 stop:521 length:261 start_codon:yes stop_codon:yes gene_type:complete